MNLPADGRAQNSFQRFILGAVVHIVILTTLTWLFCWGMGVYTVRKATDALLMISFCYTLLGVSTWAGRALRFYNATDHFTSLMKATEHDRPDLSPLRRGWLLLVWENRIFIGWVAAGLVLMAAALVLGKTYPPDHVVQFLVRPNLPPNLKPGF